MIKNIVDLLYSPSNPVKVLRWLGSSKKDLRELPPSVIQKIGYGLWVTQNGQHCECSKPLKKLGSGVHEIWVDFNKCTYRAVYNVGYPDAVYVVHVFQKKATSGIKTPQPQIEMIKQRLSLLKQHTIRRKNDE